MGTGELLGQGRWRVLLFCWLGWVFDFYDLMLFAFVKGDVAQELKLGLGSTIAWIDGLTLLASAVGGYVFGRLADRVGRRQAMVTCILCYALGAFATGLAAGHGSLLLARMLTGFGTGGEWGIGHAVVAETFSGRARDRAHALLQAGSPVAMALAAAVGCFVAPRVGWRPCYLWSALPGLLVFAARWALPLPAAGERAPAPAAALLFRVPLRRASVVLLLVLVLHMTGFWCVYAWLPQALAHDAGATPSQVGVFQIEVNTVHVLADIAFGWLAVRYGRIRTFVGFCLLFAAGQTLVAATLPTLLLDRTLLTVAICAMGLGAGSWSCFGALFGALYPAALRATAAATFYNLARGAQLFSQPLMGVLFTTTGSFAPALWIGAVCALASALVVRWLPAAARTHAGSEQVGSV